MSDADKIAAFDRIVAIARPHLQDGQPVDDLAYAILKELRPFVERRCLVPCPKDEAEIVRSLAPPGHGDHELYHLAVIDLDCRYSCSCGNTFRFASGVIESQLKKVRRHAVR